MFGHEVVVGVLLYMPSFFARKMTKDGFQAFVMGLTVSFCSTGDQGLCSSVGFDDCLDKNTAKLGAS